MKAEVSEKLDGSLGVLYQWMGEYYIATRGSFVSEQAQWANKWYQENMAEAVWSCNTTPLFEIIFKANKIVVDYNYEGLVLLGIVENDLGLEWMRPALERAAEINGCRIAKKFEKSLAECAAENAEGAEGYVLRYTDASLPYPLRIKVKFAEYVRLHRLLTGVSPKAIWELLRDTGSVDTLCENVPDTFVRWVREWECRLFADFEVMEIDAKLKFELIKSEIGADTTRKDWALRISELREEIRPVLFRMLDGRTYADIIWKRVRPEVVQGDVFRKDPDTIGA
jgi:RNA ligase